MYNKNKNKKLLTEYKIDNYSERKKTKTIVVLTLLFTELFIITLTMF